MIKPPPNKPDPVDSSQLWQDLSHQDSVSFWCNAIHLFDEKVFFATTDLDKLNVLKMYDKISGNLIWAKEISGYLNISAYGFTKDYIIANERSYIHIINAQTGKTVHIVDWFNFRDDICGLPRMNVIGDWIYHSASPCQRGNPDQTFMRYHIPDGRIDTLIDIVGHINGGYVGGLERPKLWMHPNGDSVLIFQNRTINFGTSRNRVDLFAWSLKTRDTLWLIDSLTPSGFANVNSPQIYDDKIYMREFFNVFCINPMDGSIVWNSVATDMGVSNLDILFNEKRFYLHEGIREMYAYDINTGDLIWMADEKDGQDLGRGEFMTYHKGFIYSTYGDISATDANNGKVKWTYRTPNYNKTLKLSTANLGMSDGLIIDPETDLMYVHDGFFAMCVKLPEKLK